MTAHRWRAIAAVVLLAGGETAGQQSPGEYVVFALPTTANKG
ncbi:MAG: hypothetical protein ABJA98_21045 [Acidobacteriota bacterium]